MELKRTSLLISEEKLKPIPFLDNLVMAWAVDATTLLPCYILELDATHGGAKCNCKCPSCNLPLIAVNVGKSAWKNRPHFRHPKGAAREDCIIIAARKAIKAMFGLQERIVLPRRRRSSEVEGLSGTYYDAWVERPAEAVRIAQCEFKDEANALLKLDDGRQLHVRLVGSGETTNDFRDKNQLTACIEIQTDDPAVANMAPDEIIARLELVWGEGCWVRHWADGEMDAEAIAFARGKAANALDWIDAGGLPDNLSQAERRETLLHREVKAILERERRIRIPGLTVESTWRRANGFVDKRTWASPDVEIQLSSVELEVHLGQSVPDVVATWVEKDGLTHSMLIEVTVTNPIRDERIERLSSFGWPVLEIDIRRMGGAVTRDELARLVLDEVAGKHWLYHPVLKEENTRQIAAMQQEEAWVIEVERRQQEILNVPAQEWAKRYLSAFRRRWQEQQIFGIGIPDSKAWHQAQADVSGAIQGLAAHGYPASLLDEYPLRKVIARILSILDGTGIEYQTDVWGVINAILCDGIHARKYHTLYLIALKIYSPALAKDHQEKIVVWRGDVVESIRSEGKIYIRETTYDRLLSLLFPEMSSALSEPFGTPLYIPEREREYEESLSTTQPHSSTALLHAEPSSVPHKYDKTSAELLRVSGHAARNGQSPLSFAKDYARQIGGLTVEQIINKLIECGVAKDRLTWS